MTKTSRSEGVWPHSSFCGLKACGRIAGFCGRGRVAEELVWWSEGAGALGHPIPRMRVSVEVEFEPSSRLVDDCWKVQAPETSLRASSSMACDMSGWICGGRLKAEVLQAIRFVRTEVQDEPSNRPNVL